MTIGRKKEIGHETVCVFRESGQFSTSMPALWLSIGVKFKGRRKLAEDLVGLMMIIMMTMVINIIW